MGQALSWRGRGGGGGGRREILTEGDLIATGVRAPSWEETLELLWSISVFIPAALLAKLQYKAGTDCDGCHVVGWTLLVAGWL